MCPYAPQVTTHFFQAYSHPLETDDFQRLLAQIISNAKSSNSQTRASTVQLFETITTSSRSRNVDGLAFVAVSELLNLPKTGKSSGPDHRVALYSMLSFLKPSADVSPLLISTSTPLLAKETHEGATAVLAAALPPHVLYIIGDDDSKTTLSAETTALIAKEMNNAKPAVRRAFCTLAGSVFFEGESELITAKATAFAKAVLPSFEKNMQTVAANPLNSSGGPLEGYVALATLLGPFSQSGKFGTSLKSPFCLGPSSIDDTHCR